jgi:hypothetical protein
MIDRFGSLDSEWTRHVVMTSAKGRQGHFQGCR